MRRRSDRRRLFALQDPALEREIFSLTRRRVPLWCVIIFGAACYTLLGVALKRWGVSGVPAAFGCGVVVGLMINGIQLLWFPRRKHERAVYELLASHGRCTSCGYRLSECNAGRCPECGQPTDPNATETRTVTANAAPRITET